MLLSFSNGDQFATGSMPYSYRSITQREEFERIILQVQIEGFTTEAYLDTGAIYLVCSPDVARQANIPAKNLFSSPDPVSISLRGIIIQGDLTRVSLTLLADDGYGINVEVTAFIPRIGVQVEWEDFPCLLGLHGCLERIRFAIDPLNTNFYFGSL